MTGSTVDPAAPILAKDCEIEELNSNPLSKEIVVPINVEEISVERRRVPTSIVRVSTVTHRRTHLVDELLTHERVVVEHVPVGRYVDSVPPVRTLGDVTIMSVVEEVVVVEKRLLLREEVHVRRVRTTEQHVETVELREQEAVITRTPANETHTHPSPIPQKLETDT